MDANEIDTIIDWIKDRISTCEVMISFSSNKREKDHYISQLEAYKNTLKCVEWYHENN